MADLTWSDVVLVGGIATVGFILLSYWFSGLMSRRGWSWQIKRKPRPPARAKAEGGPSRHGGRGDGKADGNAGSGPDGDEAARGDGS